MPQASGNGKALQPSGPDNGRGPDHERDRILHSLDELAREFSEMTDPPASSSAPPLAQVTMHGDDEPESAAGSERTPSHRRLIMGGAMALVYLGILGAAGFGIARFVGTTAPERPTAVSLARHEIVPAAASAAALRPVATDASAPVAPAASPPPAAASAAAEAAPAPPAAAVAAAPAPAAKAVASEPVSASPPRTVAVDATEAALLRQRGDLLRVEGDIAQARLFYERAAGLGDGEAALLAGDTYDPARLASWGVVGIPGDPAMATRWYQRALALGATMNGRLDAQAQLDQHDKN
jgi:hypothetical protein